MISLRQSLEAIGPAPSSPKSTEEKNRQLSDESESGAYPSDLKQTLLMP